MIGEVQWDHAIDGFPDPVRVTMTLGDDAVFRSEQMPRYAAGLTEQLRERPGHVEGYRDAVYLHELAERHNGTLTLAEPKPSPPGTIH